MGDLIDMLIGRMHRRAIDRVGALAAELVRTPSDGREAVLAELEFNHWLAEYCEMARRD